MSDSGSSADTAAGTDVAVVKDGDISAFRTLYDPALDFRKLVDEASYFARGFRKVEKDDLVGVPFVVLNAVYREGFLDAARKVKGDYVSLECVVADKETLASPQMIAQRRTARKDCGLDPNSPLSVYGNEPVIFNDGGTGIRRTMTAHLDEAGAIATGGDADRPYQLWKSGADEATTGVSHYPDGAKFRYVAIRGLRKSEYDNEFGHGTTFYFA